MSQPELFGLVLPPGEERKVLYESEHRLIATYDMPIEDLDRELKHIIDKRGSIIKEDERRNFCGRIEVVTQMNKIVHMAMDKCGSTDFVTLKYWVDI